MDLLASLDLLDPDFAAALRATLDDPDVAGLKIFRVFEIGRSPARQLARTSRAAIR